MVYDFSQCLGLLLEPYTVLHSIPVNWHKNIIKHELLKMVLKVGLVYFNLLQFSLFDISVILSTKKYS